MGAGTAFSKGRDFAAWLGLVPKQMSTGDRTILGRKRGNRHLRDAKMTTAMPNRLTHYRATSSKSEMRVANRRANWTPIEVKFAAD